MNFEEGLQTLDTAVFSKTNRHLSDAERIILQSSWQGLTYEEIADSSNHYTAEYLRQFVGFNLWRLLSEILGEKVSKTNFRAAIERLYLRNKNLVPAEVHPDTCMTIKNGFVPEEPEGSLRLNSVYYIQRPPIEQRCYEKILQSGSLIRIKAPNQMGKTSLLDRIIAHSSQHGYHKIRLNLARAERNDLSNLNNFLRWFCNYISETLRLPSLLNETWHEYRGSIVNCTTYFEDHILYKIDNNLVLALDNVDRIFQYSEISQGFFPCYVLGMKKPTL